jgi:hypothetical protein
MASRDCANTGREENAGKRTVGDEMVVQVFSSLEWSCIDMRDTYMKKERYFSARITTRVAKRTYERMMFN